jgi:hypothetical protein
MVDAVKREYTNWGLTIIIVFLIVGIITLISGIIPNQYGNRSLKLSAIGIFIIVIGCIPFMLNTPAIPTISRSGSTITVTNYSSLGDNPTLELWMIDVNENILNEKLFDMKENFNKTTNSWTGAGVNVAVRNYNNGLVFSQSVTI